MACASCRIGGGRLSFHSRRQRAALEDTKKRTTRRGERVVWGRSLALGLVGCRGGEGQSGRRVEPGESCWVGRRGNPPAPLAANRGRGKPGATSGETFTLARPGVPIASLMSNR